MMNLAAAYVLAAVVGLALGWLLHRCRVHRECWGEIPSCDSAGLGEPFTPIDPARSELMDVDIDITNTASGGRVESMPGRVFRDETEAARS